MSPAPDDPRIAAIVEQAWRATLPHVAWDPDGSWAEAGADSLKALALVLHLEAALGRRVPYDLLDREMTPRRLARALAADATPATSAAVHVFLLPGLFGDEPILADFRRALAADITFEMVPPPGIETPMRVLADMRRSGAAIAGRIAAAQPDGPIRLAGFSFGGALAYEAARHLVDSGREVALLALLDAYPGVNPAMQADYEATARLSPAIATSHGGALRRLAPRGGERPGAFVERYVFAAMMRAGAVEIGRRMALRSRPRLTPERWFERERFVLGHGRMRAMRGWRPDPLDVPTLLAASDTGMTGGAPDRWGALIPRLETVHVPGLHLQMFGPRALEILCPAFVAAARR